MYNQLEEKKRVVVEVRNISKEFPGVKALDGLSLSVSEGEVHGLIGENGSGKSTLIKCLSGVYQPDDGEILLNGKKTTIHNPIIARSLGIATIYQEFSLIPTLTVAENVFLGRLPKKAGTGAVDWEEMRRGTAEILKRMNISISPDSIVRDLSVAEQQLVEIAKALSSEAKVLIMDEPTTALDMEEIKNLHKLVRHMAADGYAIIYISHRLDEVLEVVDYITIMKDGHLVGNYDKSEIDMNCIVQKMIGSEIKEHYPKVYNAKNEVLLQVENIHSLNGVNGVSFTINRGEVFGLAGAMGSGRTEIARALFGIDKLTAGIVKINGVPIKLRSPVSAIKAGMAFVTENRKTDGLFFDFEAPGNITVASLNTLIKWGKLDLKSERSISLSFIEKLHIHPTAMIKSVQFLSGGNQQKVIIARWLFSKAELFIFDEPTQGIDVAAKVEVCKLINELTSQGKSILLISSDLPELLAMSDHVGVVKFGRIIKIAHAKELDRVSIIQD